MFHPPAFGMLSMRSLCFPTPPAADSASAIIGSNLAHLRCRHRTYATSSRLWVRRHFLCPSFRCEGCSSNGSVVLRQPRPISLPGLFPCSVSLFPGLPNHHSRPESNGPGNLRRLRSKYSMMLLTHLIASASDTGLSSAERAHLSCSPIPEPGTKPIRFLLGQPKGKESQCRRTTGTTLLGNGSSTPSASVSALSSLFPAGLDQTRRPVFHDGMLAFQCELTKTITSARHDIFAVGYIRPRAL